MATAWMAVYSMRPWDRSMSASMADHSTWRSMGRCTRMFTVYLLIMVVGVVQNGEEGDGQRAPSPSKWCDSWCSLF